MVKEGGVSVYPFGLDFREEPLCASFPFIYEGEAVKGIRCLVSSRSAGNMVYSAEGPAPACGALFRTLGLEAGRVRRVRQIHSRRVLAVEGAPAADGDVPAADGMVTADRNVCLSVTVADCLPVFLYDTGSGAFGLLHSGWRGTGIVLSALALMKDRWHTRPEALAAVLGPGIGVCCYSVDEGRAAAFEGDFGGSGGPWPLGPVTERRVQPEGGPQWYLNLRAANARLLAAAGVRHIAVCGDCTFTGERLGSYRREGKSYTRMMALTGYF
ncbi:MAG: polyphenol oxidase family protein [Treponema sp.]|jgi:YfiH family protein|nr:polyphenol oxidase family protein [Treponema sp.]